MYIMVTKKTLSFAHEALMCLLMFYFLSAVVVMNEQLKLDLRDLTKREKQTHKHHHHVTITQLYNMAKQHSKEVSNNSNNVRIQVPDPDIWQTVVPKKLFAYSSYLDTRHSKEDGINILVIVHLDYKTPLYCQIWHHHNGDPLLVSGTMEKFPEQFTGVYSAAFLNCHFKKFSHHQQPLAVSVVTNTKEGLPNLLKVHSNNNNNEWSSHYNFTVCLGGPLKFGLNNTNQFTEWLELNALFGADHFILYNHSASTDMQPYVDYYVNKRKLIEWLPWQLPDTIENPREMKNFGHLGLVNDCLYRSMYHSAMTVFMDTDEFIVPRQNNVKTWHNMLEQTSCMTASSISVRNVFFKKEWPDDSVTSENKLIKQLDLVTQLKTKREHKIWPHMSRSKYMVRPETVMVTGIHRVWRFVGSQQRTCKLKEEDALVHHYRWWDDPKPKWVIDRLMHNHQTALVSRVQEVHEQVTRSWKQ